MTAYVGSKTIPLRKLRVRRLSPHGDALGGEMIVNLHNSHIIEKHLVLLVPLVVD